MTPRKYSALLVSMLAIFLSALHPATATATARMQCPNVHFDSVLHVAAGRAGLVADAVIRDDCTLDVTTRSVAAPDLAASDDSKPIAGRQLRRPFPRIGPGRYPGPDPDYHENNQILDPGDFNNLTQIVTDLSATTDGSVITGWSGGGYQQYHGEVPDPTCNNGPGWYPLSGNGTFYWSGGNGQTWIAVHGRGWFGYQGQFDCSGTVYENHLDSYVYVYADGSALCQWNQWWKTGFPGWHLHVTCYNPFAVKVDRTL